MKISEVDKLYKVLNKKRGNTALKKNIDKFVKDYQENDFENKEELKKIRNKIDNVHKNQYYIDNIGTYRCLIKVSFRSKAVFILWFGTHKEYESKLKNNKKSAEKFIDKFDV